MNAINRILFFLHASNLIVALAGAFLAFGICKQLNIDYAERYGFLAFCLIFSIYFFQRMVDHSGFSEDERNVWGNRTWLAIGLSTVLLFLGFVVGLQMVQYSVIQITLIVVFSLICGWYVIPLFGSKLREIAGLKLVLIAATWTYTCLVFPYLNVFKEFTTDLMYFALLLIFYISAVVLPFDIRDKSIDLVQQSTVPQVIGVRVTKLIGTILLLIFSVGMYVLKIVEPTNILFASSILIQIALLNFTTEKRPFYYFLSIDFCIGLLGLSFLF